MGKKGMRTCLKDLLNNYQVDFVGLQETIKKPYSEKFFRLIDPGQTFAWHWIPSRGRSGGTRKDIFELIKVEEGVFSISALLLDRCLKNS